MTMDARSESRIDLLWTARFLTEQCHVGSFALPWDTEEWVECPKFGDEFSRSHLLWDC